MYMYILVPAENAWLALILRNSNWPAPCMIVCSLWSVVRLCINTAISFCSLIHVQCQYTIVLSCTMWYVLAFPSWQNWLLLYWSCKLKTVTIHWLLNNAMYWCAHCRTKNWGSSTVQYIATTNSARINNYTLITWLEHHIQK